MTTQLLNDRYRIIRKIGSGGFGDTFLAEDTHMPSQRHCVVKGLRPIQTNTQINQLVQERFQREAAILETLGSNHSQIPTLYAYFYSKTDQQFYLIQEWIDGDTLGDIIRQRNKLNEAEVRQILVALLPIFDYVHSQSIIHRDVKPENIIVRHSDQQPVLIDFGAVRESMGVGVNSQGNPTQSIVIGTPGYMASEQSIGRPVYSSDLYSLGMTAIYLLTGKQPQDLPSNPHTGELIWQTDTPGISPDLANILNKAIAFHPRDRYQTANEFRSALQGNPNTVATQVIPVQTPSNTKSQLPLIGAIAACAALAMALVATMLSRSPETKVSVIASPSSSPTTTINSQESSPLSTKNPEKSPSLTSSDTPKSTPQNSGDSPSINKTTDKLSCNYFTGNAVAGQTVNVDLCSITNNGSEKIRFTYYLGNQRMDSEANCADGSWTTFSNNKNQKPLSAATQKMIDRVCNRSIASQNNSQMVRAFVFAPPSNVRESPDGNILCSIKQQQYINTYGVANSWYKTDFCGSMGVISADQLRF
jgi:serine/threonine protein kinase, bacterial